LKVIHIKNILLICNQLVVEPGPFVFLIPPRLSKASDLLLTPSESLPTTNALPSWSCGPEVLKFLSES
jgi:hypothetical protein